MSKVYESLDTKILVDSETGEVIQQEVSTKVIKKVAQEDYTSLFRRFGSFIKCYCNIWNTSFNGFVAYGII